MIIIFADPSPNGSSHQNFCTFCCVEAEENRRLMFINHLSQALFIGGEDKFGLKSFFVVNHAKEYAIIGKK